MAKDDATSNNNNMITQLINTSIKDATNNKKSLGLKLESVMNLMRQVEGEEKAAEQAKEEASQSSLDVLVKLDQSKKALRHAEETNDMLVTKVCVQKAVLATKMEVIQLGSSHLLEEGERFFQVLDEMSRSLETRLNSASMKKELSVKKKQENEAFARAALAYEGIQMEKVERELKNLKQEAAEISKLVEFVIDGGQALHMLDEEISDKYQNVKQLKQELDQGSTVMSILVASISSSLESFKSKNEADVTEDSTKENKLCGSKLCIKKVKIKKKFKIKGLRVVSKRTAAADHRDDDIQIVTLGILFICLLLFILGF